MTNILVISDTHHNYQIMKHVLEIEDNIDIIIHLGDEHDDIDFFPEYTNAKTVYSVPGIYHKDYLSYPQRRVITFEIDNWLFKTAHTPKDLGSPAHCNDIIMHGHTHKALIDQHNDYTLLNPGHLKDIKDRGHNASYIVIRTDLKQAEISLKELNNKIIQQVVIYKNENR